MRSATGLASMLRLAASAWTGSDSIVITVPPCAIRSASASAPTPVNVPTSSTRRAAPTVTSAASSRLSTSALAICGAPEFASVQDAAAAVAGGCGVVCAVA